MTDDPSIGKRYSEDEMRAILSLAMQHDQVIRASVSQSELESVAAEIGISSEALDAALAAHESRNRNVPVAPIAPLPDLAWRSTLLGVSVGVASQAPLVLGGSQTLMLLTPVAIGLTLMISGAAASQHSRVGAKLGFLRFQARNLGLWLGFGGASWFIHATLLSAPADSVRAIMFSGLLWALSSAAGGILAAFRSRVRGNTGKGSASPAMTLVRRAARRLGAWLSRISARLLRRSTFRFRAAPGSLNRGAPWLLLLWLGPTSLVAQTRAASSMAPSTVYPRSRCVVAASVIGGGIGMFVGAVVGSRVERAFYKSNEDAGVTGLVIGSIAGAMGGIVIARKTCDGPNEEQLRNQLYLQNPNLVAAVSAEEPGGNWPRPGSWDFGSDWRRFQPLQCPCGVRKPFGVPLTTRN